MGKKEDSRSRGKGELKFGRQKGDGLVGRQGQSTVGGQNC